MCWKCSKTTQNIMKLARLKSLHVTLGISHWTLIMIQLMTSKKTNLKRTKRTGKKGNTWFERISRKWGKRRFCWWVERAVKSRKKRKKKERCPREHSRYDEMLEIQKQQLKLLEEWGKRFQAFQSEMLEKQLQREAVEKQKYIDFFWNLAKY